MKTNVKKIVVVSVLAVGYIVSVGYTVGGRARTNPFVVSSPQSSQSDNSSFSSNNSAYKMPALDKTPGKEILEKEYEITPDEFFDYPSPEEVYP